MGRAVFNYMKTVDRIKPDYLGKRFLVASQSKERLFMTKVGAFIEVVLSKDGDLEIFEIMNGRRAGQLPYSLRGFGGRYLGLKDSSVSTMLRHLVLPEMEIERIFNCLRYKYLQAILLSSFDSPGKFISAEYNKAFQSLAGIVVYQGQVKKRKRNDVFWREVGFSRSVKDRLEFYKEREDLRRILQYMRHADREDITTLYAELIAIKPGFHEMYLHDNYFEEIPQGEDPRSAVFRALRNKGSLVGLRMVKMPSQINSKSYLSYASCAITEGPFVFRRSPTISYCESMRKIRSKGDLPVLQKDFFILDYKKASITSRKNLKALLGHAERFTGFMV